MALTDVLTQTTKPREKTYKFSDAHGLYLLISTVGSKCWHLKYRLVDKESRIAFGAYPLISLVKGREKRDEVKLLLSNGVNPVEKLEGKRKQRRPRSIL